MDAVVVVGGPLFAQRSTATFHSDRQRATGCRDMPEGYRLGDAVEKSEFLCEKEKQWENAFTTLSREEHRGRKITSK